MDSRSPIGVEDRLRGNDGGVVFGGVGLWVSVGGHRDPPLRLRSGEVMRLLIRLLFQFFVHSVMSFHHAYIAVG